MYDVATNIVTGDIVYWSGGGKSGVVPDITLAKNWIVNLIDEGEKIIPDKGYRDDEYFIYSSDVRGDNSVIKKITGRHENTNARLKVWGFLRNRFRPDFATQRRFFSAIIEMEQFNLTHGNRPQKLSLHGVSY